MWDPLMNRRSFSPRNIEAPYVRSTLKVSPRLISTGACAGHIFWIETRVIGLVS